MTGRDHHTNGLAIELFAAQDGQQADAKQRRLEDVPASTKPGGAIAECHARRLRVGVSSGGKALDGEEWGGHRCLDQDKDASLAIKESR